MDKGNNKIKNKILKEDFNSILKELEILHIIDSLKKSNFKKLIKAHNSIHEVMWVAPHCVPENKSYYEKSAFLAVYIYNIFYSAHRSFLEVLSGYYNCAYTLLRNSLESVIEGAYYECLAHKIYRNYPQIREITKTKKFIKLTIKGWINYLINLKPEIEEELEKNSVYIFDKLEVIFKKEKFSKDEEFFNFIKQYLPSKIEEFKDKEEISYEKIVHIPRPSQMVCSLCKWDIFSPIPNFEEMWTKLYNKLSLEAHAYPDQTEVGRRIYQLQKEIFESEVIPEELNRFYETLLEVIDIAIVTELNILSDWIKESEDIRGWLKSELPIIEKDLQLNYTSLKIRNLIEKK